jgi:Cys-tRNA(Pro) deacylase
MGGQSLNRIVENRHHSIMTTLHPSVERFLEDARARGFDFEVVEFSQSTRTAPEAAAAIGCDVAQIVKSLCFVANDKPIMTLVSGANQLDTKKLAVLLGVGRKRIRRADAAIVKASTGYSIGGVPPFGHISQMTVFVDAELMQFDEIWAAAGTPNSVFPLAPATLVAASTGQVADLKREEA